MDASIFRGPLQAIAYVLFPHEAELPIQFPNDVKLTLLA
jgi:hypothetical protein